MTATTSRRPADDFDYLSVNHFHNLFATHFELLVPVDELPSPKMVGPLRQRLLGLLREIKAIRDPTAHPVEEELPVEDAIRAVDSARRVLVLLHREEQEPVAAIFEALIRERALSEAPEVVTPPDDTLPPSESVVVDFVGREEELASLWKWLIDPFSRRWLLSGDGGKGKSAIAYRLAQDVRRASPHDLTGIFWLSGKRRRFAEGTVEEIRSPDFWDLDSALTKILRDYGATGELDKSTDSKRVTVLGLLEELPVLLIVDDIDAIQPEAEDVIEFLSLDVPKTRTKVLIMSRRLIMGFGNTCTVVEGLPETTALEFIDKRLSRMGISPDKIKLATKKQIVTVCEGSPLYMEDLLRLLAFLGAAEAIALWVNKAGEGVRQYALERELAMLSGKAREVLEVCALVGGSVSAIELQRITGRDEDVVLAAIDELRRMYLVSLPEFVEGVPRFQLNRNLGALMRASLGESSRKLKLEGAIREVAGKGPGKAAEEAVGAFVRQARALVEARRYQEAEETLRRGLEHHPNNSRLLGTLGWVFKRWSSVRVTDARDAFRRAYELGSKDSLMYVQWGRMEEDEGDWKRASEAIESGLERLQDHPGLLQLAGYYRSRLGQALRRAMHEERGLEELYRADSYLKKALKRAEQLGLDSQTFGRAYRALILNAQALGDDESICAWLQKWLEAYPRDLYAREELDRQRGRCPEVSTGFQP